MRRVVLFGLAAVVAVAAGLVLLAGGGAAPAGLANPGFEDAGSPPPGWTLDAAAAPKGTLGVEPVAGANGRALALRPNPANRGGEKPFGVGQIVDAARLRGRVVAVGATLGAEGDAAAVMGVVLLDAKGAPLGAPALLRGAGPLAPQTTTLDAPDAAQSAIVFLIAEGQAGVAWFDDVFVEAQAAPAAATPAPGAPFTARVAIDASRDLGPVRRALFGANVEWIRNAQGLWNAQTRSLDAAMLGLARDAGVSVLRFPGGGWSDSYDWRRGVGPQDARPAAIHAPGEKETSPNVVGTDEIIEAARAIGADLLLTLNLGQDDPALAGAWARYVRERVKPDQTPRIVWELGNELYMADDISHGQTDPKTYVERARRAIAAVREADPAARFYAIGLLNYGRYRFNAHADWNEIVLRGLAQDIKGLAIHNAYAPLLPGDDRSTPAAVYRAMLVAPTNIAANLADTTRQLQAAEGGKRLTLAVTEWGPLFAVDPKSPFFDHAKTLGSGLFAARALNAFLRAPRVVEADFFKLSDLLNVGWIGRLPQGGYAATPALEALRLYARTLEGRLVGAAVESPVFTGGPAGFVDRAEAPLVDAVAALWPDGDLGLVLSNASLDAPATVELALDAARRGVMELMSGPAPDASRGTAMIDVPGLVFAAPANFGKPREKGADEVRIGTSAVGPATRLTITLPPTSVAALRLKAAP